MDLSSLKPALGSRKNKKRIGRGQGSGRGGTSTKGHNGAQSRSGYKRRYNSEGGQMPLQVRVPKFGFNSPNRVVYRPINLSTLQLLSEKEGVSNISQETYINNGLANKRALIKILGNGELKAKIEVNAHSFSESAKKSIEALGGKVTILSKK